MKKFNVDLITSKIYILRGHRIMLDSDLAILYGTETRILNQAVKRNSDRFPEDFMLQVTDIEWNFLISQFVISNPLRGGRQIRPFAFTEYGIAMISSVLNSPEAIQVNIAIMRTFGQLRQVLKSNKGLASKIDALESRYDGQFKVVFNAIRELVSEKSVPRKRIKGLNSGG